MCLAQRFSPKSNTFKWSLDGKEVTKAIDKCDKSEKKGSVTEYSATSILQISAGDWKPNTKVKCEFVHKAGNEEREAEFAGMISLENCECFENRNVYFFSVSLFILCLCLPKSVCFLFPAIFQDCSDIAVDIVAPSLEAMLKNREGVLKCKASADNSGFTKITITANNNDIAEKPVEGNDKYVELDAPIGYEEWSNGTEFTCTKPTVFILAPPEHKPGEPMTLTCYVKDFYPKEVFVSWLADDEPVTSKYSTSLPIQTDQIFSVYSQLTVNDSKWKNGTVFSCVVYHEGIDEKMRVLTSVNISCCKPTIALLSREDGDRIVLECQLNDYFPDKLTVQWLEGINSVKGQIDKKLQNTDKGEKKYTYLSIMKKIMDNFQNLMSGSLKSNFIYFTCTEKSLFKPSVQVKKSHLRDIIQGSQVTISCVVKAPDNTEVSWLINGISRKGTTEHKDPSINNIVSNLNLSRQELTHSTIVCTAKHPCFKLEKVEIKKDPVVVIRRPFVKSMQAASAVLECVVNGLPSGEVCIIFQSDDTPVSGLNCVDWAPSENIWSLITHFTIPSEHQKNGKTFTCTVHRLSKSWKSKPTGNIFGNPTIELAVVPSVSRSSLDTQKLLCSATGFDPKIKWLSVSGENPGRALDATMMEDGRVKVFSEILVPQQEWNQEITCQTKTKTKTAEESISICTVIAPSSQRAEFYLVGPSLSSVRSDTSVYLTCLVVVQSVKLFSIQWKVNGIVPNPNGHEQEPRVHDNGTESKESILKVFVTDWNAYALFTCEVKHLCSDYTQEKRISKTRDPKQPTVRILRPSDSDLSGLQNACLLCLITGFFPSDISVQWQLNETQLDASQFTNSPVAAHTSGGFSMHSALMLPASEWKDGTFSCVVSHESSQNPITATIENLYASLIRSPPSVELLQGTSVPELVCLVFGFSPPAINITWWLGKTEMSAHRITHPAKGPDGKFSIRSHLDLQPSDWVPGEVYTCEVTHVTGILSPNISTKTALFEEAIFMNENKPEAIAQDTVEEAWNMACAFLVLFLLSLFYGCTATLVKVKPT
uniref:Uncharacterized LOC107583070 n=1 Tax=Sinocyclocheilus grahami TaxID=75366 RepID=A0A672SZ48_SINGR